MSGKKLTIAALVLLLIAAVAGYLYFSGKEYTVRISESQIQQQLAKKLPIRKSYLLIFEITLDNPRVQLRDGSKRVEAGLDLTLNITLDKNPEPLGGSIDVSGGVRYEAEKGQFFLTDPLIENFAVQGVPPKYIKKVNKLLTKALAEYYEDHPIYMLKRGDAKQAFARMVLKDVTVEGKELVVTLGI